MRIFGKAALQRARAAQEIEVDDAGRVTKLGRDPFAAVEAVLRTFEELELTVDWRALEYHLETEVVLDLEHGASSYYCAWSELSAAPVEWVRVGLVVQRTRVFQTEREVAPGPFVRFSHGQVQASAYWFAPGADDQYASVSLAVEF
jgi:hypothetical protein